MKLETTLLRVIMKIISLKSKKKPIKLFLSLISFRQMLTQIVKNNMKPFDVYEAYFDSSLDVVSDLSHELIQKPSGEGEEGAPAEKAPVSKLPLLLSFLWSILWILMIACTKYSVNKLENSLLTTYFSISVI
jgi:hypothetical protein